jgi:hypothetical protein
MAVVTKEFPKEKFTEVQTEKLPEVVVEAFEILEDGNHPQFTGAYEERGAFILSCANQHTKVWVETIAPKLSPWEGASFSVGPKEQILQTYKVLFKTPKMFAKTEPSRILDMVSKQNNTGNQGLEEDQRQARCYRKNSGVPGR